MKIFGFAFLLIITFVSEGTSLECYVCDSEINGNACFDPMDDSVIKSQDCTTTYSGRAGLVKTELEELEGKSTEKMQNYNPLGYPNQYPNSYPNGFPNANPNPNFNPPMVPTWNENPTEFECVKYEKYFSRANKRQIVRKCQGRNQSPNFCSVLAEMSSFQGYTLTNCNICYSDYCNSGQNTNLSVAVLALSLFLVTCKYV